MLGWFKKKFSKNKEESPKAPEDLKIPVAPRDFGPPKEEKKPEVEAKLESQDIPEVEVKLESQDITEVEAELESQDIPEIATEEKAITTDTAPEAVEIPEPSAEVIEQVKPEEETAPPVQEGVVDDTEEQEQDESLEQPEDVQEEAITAPAEDIPEAEEIEPEIVVPVVEVEKPAPKKEIDTSQKIPVAPVRPPVPKEDINEPGSKDGFFTRLTEKLAQTRESFTYQLDTLFLGKKEIDADLLDDLEELLITADLGVSTTQEILDHARKKVKRNSLSDPAALKQVIKEKIKSFITDYQQDAELVMPDKGPFVIMVVGVNGVGKTTTIGKVAHKFVNSGQSVLLVAADTFRAAAVSQLKIWGERNNVSVISQHEGADPSSVVFDALAHAEAKDYDVVLVDTAGRLHTQSNLMDELKKIKRVMNKKMAGAPHEVMLVVDATTGQNGISQAKLFDAAVDLTGITLTKLDGTAKGGIVANICKELKTPIRFIGVGEQLEDLRDFDPDEFIEALFQGKNSEEA